MKERLKMLLWNSIDNSQDKISSLLLRVENSLKGSRLSFLPSLTSESLQTGWGFGHEKRVWWDLLVLHDIQFDKIILLFQTIEDLPFPFTCVSKTCPFMK